MFAQTAPLLLLHSDALLFCASRPRHRPRHRHRRRSITPSHPPLFSFARSRRCCPSPATVNRSLPQADEATEAGPDRGEEHGHRDRDQDEEAEGGGGGEDTDPSFSSSSLSTISSLPSSDPSIRIAPTGRNGRLISVSIPISAPLEALWRALTDYERLAEFIPGLSVCQVQERWPNGARLYQIGEQNLALGLKFKAKGVIVVTEMPSKSIPHGICRNIDFEMVEGDFKIFKGTWQMEEVTCSSTDSNTTKTLLTYVVDVQPHPWLPVQLVEGMLSSEIQNNLICVRNEVLRIESIGRPG